jgi:hypothetical protein
VLKRLILQNCGELEQGCDADSIVRCAWSDRNAIVVRVEQHRLAGSRPEHGDDIPHPCAADPALLEQLVAGKLVADDRVKADVPEDRHKTRAHRIVRDAVGRVRALVAKNVGEARLSPCGIELTGSAMRPEPRRLLQHRRGGHRAEQRHQQDRKQDDGFAHGPPCARGAPSHIALRRRLR